MKNQFLMSWRSSLLGKLLDSWHRLAIFFSSERMEKPSPFSRILLSNCGGLGDVALCAEVASEIKQRFPSCRLGFIAHAESASALEALFSIDWVHRMNYSVKPHESTLRKIFSFLQFSWIERPALVKEIKEIGYDSAIELRPFFPNMIPLFWKAKIPWRIGFTSGGNSLLLNAPCPFREQYISLNYGALLEKIGIFTFTPLVRQAPHGDPLPISSPYFVFHLSSSNRDKNFPIAFWKDLYAACQEKGFVIYFSGRGEEEAQAICQVAHDPAYNLCNQLSWRQFVQLIGQSRGLVSVDSTAVHLAAHFHTPCAVLYKIAGSHKLWCPPLPTCSPFGLHGPIKIEEIVRFLEKIW